MLRRTETFRNSIGLSIYRCVLAALVMKNMIFYYPMATSMFGQDAIVDYDNYVGLMNAYGLRFLIYPFHLAYAPQVFILLTFVAAFAFFFGIGRQIVGIGLWVLLLILQQRNGYILDGSDNVIQVTLPFLIFTDAYRYNTYRLGLSERFSGLTKLTQQPVVKLVWGTIGRFATLALLIQICYVYFFTALAKLQGSLWLNGTATYYTMRVDEFRQTSWNIPLTQNHYFVVLSTYFTIFWELSFAFLIWFRQTKWVVLFFGILLHVGIWVFMRIDNFSWIMIGSYALFVTDRNYQAIATFCKQWLPKRFQLRPQYQPLPEEQLVK